jgi:hypothetical protein
VETEVMKGVRYEVELLQFSAVRDALRRSRAKGSWHAASDDETAVRIAVAAVGDENGPAAKRLRKGGYSAHDLDLLEEKL